MDACLDISAICYIIWVTAHPYKGVSVARIKREDRVQIMGQTRQRLLEAAAEEFARAGYLGANINTISTAAGFAKGTIYNYFPSKQALLLAAIDATAQQHLDFIAEQVCTEPDPAHRLEQFYRTGFEFVTRYLPQARMLFNTINGPDEQFRAHVFEAYQPLFQFVTDEILVPGIQQGVFRVVDPAAMAMLLMTIYLGTASQLNAQGVPWLDPAQVASLILHGLQP
jgi:AcrR family transcriptional regulator